MGEKSAARYHRLKAHGICVRCGNRKAEFGYVMCSGCREYERKKGKIRWAQSSQEYKAKASARQINRYYRLKAEGICTTCGKQPVKDSHVYCESCLLKCRERSRKRRLREAALHYKTEVSE